MCSGFRAIVGQSELIRVGKPGGRSASALPVIHAQSPAKLPNTQIQRARPTMLSSTSTGEGAGSSERVCLTIYLEDISYRYVKNAHSLCGAGNAETPSHDRL